MNRTLTTGFLTFLICFTSLGLLAQDDAQLTRTSVEIRRTAYGVPHIKAETLEGAAFGLAWCELEDYGDRVILPLIRARGELAKVNGYESL